MKKLVALAALMGGFYAAPVLPVQAASMMSDADANCLILPMFKKDCWHKGAEMAAAGPKAAAHAAADIAADMKSLFWVCKPAAKGSGHMLDCGPA